MNSGFSVQDANQGSSQSRGRADEPLEEKSLGKEKKGRISSNIRGGNDRCGMGARGGDDGSGER